MASAKLPAPARTTKMLKAAISESAIRIQRQIRLPVRSPNVKSPKIATLRGVTETVVDAKRLASTKNKPSKARYVQKAKGYR